MKEQQLFLKENKMEEELGTEHLIYKKSARKWL